MERSEQQRASRARAGGEVAARAPGRLKGRGAPLPRRPGALGNRGGRPPWLGKPHRPIQPFRRQRHREGDGPIHQRTRRPRCVEAPAVCLGFCVGATDSLATVWGSSKTDTTLRDSGRTMDPIRCGAAAMREFAERPAFFLRLPGASRLYLEMQARKLHVHDTHGEFLDCADAGGRAVSPAVSEFMSDGPPPAPTAPPTTGGGESTVAEITNKILAMLQAGELAPAHRYAQEWVAKGASSEGLDATVYKRWDLTRELLGAAWEIPMPITSALAKGIDANNPATVAEDLKKFAKTNAEGAAAADKVLAEKAPGIYPYIPGALKAAAATPKFATAAPRPTYYDYSPAPVYTSSSSSTTWPIWGVVGVIVVAFVRCAAISSHSSSYDYDPPSYSYDNSWNDDKYKDLQRALDDINKNKDLYGYDYTGSDSYSGGGSTDDDYKPAVPAGPPEVPELYADSDNEDLYSDISTSLSALYRVDMTSDKQQQYLEKLDEAVVDRDCTKMKKYIGQLMYSKPGETLDYAALAKDHMKAIKKRVDIVCKKSAKKAAAPKKPADDTTGDVVVDPAF
ncbi:MAG TPA: hypothetical protein VM509_04945 [Planctomycetota bacterium]|nr:hypothetical protein [Planctomycetota bacterium]